jgi:hypothetical protein
MIRRTRTRSLESDLSILVSFSLFSSWIGFKGAALLVFDGHRLEVLE